MNQKRIWKAEYNEDYGVPTVELTCIPVTSEGDISDEHSILARHDLCIESIDEMEDIATALLQAYNHANDSRNESTDTSIDAVWKDIQKIQKRLSDVEIALSRLHRFVHNINEPGENK